MRTQTTDERALKEIEAAMCIIDKHLENGFLAEVFVDERNCLGFVYVPGRYAEIATKAAAAAA